MQEAVMLAVGPYHREQYIDWFVVRCVELDRFAQGNKNFGRSYQTRNKRVRQGKALPETRGTKSFPFKQAI
ncbi:hypothetical protein ASD63_27795 [Ensifer sp. Root558]|nr:hypothetical protein ASD63_27795 [Ensifer sp. Root558]